MFGTEIMQGSAAFDMQRSNGPEVLSYQVLLYLEALIYKPMLFLNNKAVLLSSWKVIRLHLQHNGSLS